MRILVVKTSSMGDVLHTLPALTDAAHHIPDLKIDWVVEENFAQIPGWHPAVDRVIPVAIRRWRKSWFSKAIQQERSEFIKQLRQYHYDLIIDAQGLLKSAFFVTRKALGTKHGLDWHSAREPMASWFYNVRHSIAKDQHAVERIRQLFALSLGYSLPQEKGDYMIANHFLSPYSSVEAPYLIFLHATTRDEKHWPEQHWRGLIQLVQPSGLKIKLPWGTQLEQERATRLAEGFQHVEVLPKLTLAEIANFLAQTEAVISVDTGLSHLTAALDRPNITLYGPTDPGLIGGYGRNQHQIKSRRNTMADITADSVYSMLLTLLNHK